MSGLSKLVIGLTVVFVVSVVALIAQVVYVIWCRRRFRRENSTGEPDFTGKPFASPSKELLYFFCWKNQSRIEPAVPPTSLASDAQDAAPELVDPLKWHGLYGPSRVLFTIKEEREDAESQKSSAERKPKKRQSLEECFEVTNSEELEEIVKVEVEVERGTPFTTPCGSPPYYTPCPSPPREVQRSVVELENVPHLQQHCIRVDLGVDGMQRELPEIEFNGKSKEGCNI
ncbi:PREDICTED: uncharacterized protein LOC104601369 [Nelumbo nucifera]|uniref:Uncharacterized protein LOC104601369 n=1 Tax=Nelumbo nucifera TaxID=4432 RepID=A0A1U8AK75_NELNU|nr:PREDICTED: uncharacterized protein LOC104601369 [Nelumbo nucifera]